ncbi:MAG: hypothetical protein R3B07_27685 [Polyangiaceae bacterium]
MGIGGFVKGGVQMMIARPDEYKEKVFYKHPISSFHSESADGRFG